MIANLELAKQVIGAHFELDGMEVYEADRLRHLAEQTGNHYFEWGAESYSSWQVEDAASWVAELKPVLNDTNTITDYTVVFIERVN